jgi:hypothetical protein
MRLLISIGMVIVFISAFFVIFTVDSIIRNDLSCEATAEGKTVCTLESMGFAFLLKAAIILVFILIDVFAVYLIVTNVIPHGTYFVRRGGREF